jgi:hypothetical protein
VYVEDCFSSHHTDWSIVTNRSEIVAGLVSVAAFIKESPRAALNLYTADRLTVESAAGQQKCGVYRR